MQKKEEELLVFGAWLMHSAGGDGEETSRFLNYLNPEGPMEAQPK